MIDLERRWRGGQIHAMRQMPRHWRLEVDRDWWPSARRWLGGVAIVGALCLVLAAVAAAPTVLR